MVPCVGNLGPGGPRVRGVASRAAATGRALRAAASQVRAHSGPSHAVRPGLGLQSTHILPIIRLTPSLPPLPHLPFQIPSGGGVASAAAARPHDARASRTGTERATTQTLARRGQLITVFGLLFECT